MLASIYRKVQYLSLDIVLGAVILLRFFSTQLGASVDPVVYFLLAGSIWSIYTIDHLRDASRAKVGARGRYQFHSRSQRTLKGVVILVLALCGLALFLLDLALLVNGSILVALSLLYLLVHPFLSRIGAKEMYVAVIYSVGILLAPFTSLSEVRWEILFLLFILSLANLILFSWFDEKEDQRDGFESIATVLGKNQVEMIIMLILALGFGTTLLLAVTSYSIFFFLAFAAYTFILLRPEWSLKHQYYRLIGDGIFMLPMPLLWM